MQGSTMARRWHASHLFSVHQRVRKISCHQWAAMADRWQYKYDITGTSFVKSGTTFDKTCTTFPKSCTTFWKTCTTFLKSCSTFDKTGTSYTIFVLSPMGHGCPLVTWNFRTRWWTEKRWDACHLRAMVGKELPLSCYPVTYSALENNG